MTNVATSRIEGFLNVLKPYGWTSHDVVQVVRKLTGVRRVGHGGTLDPAAVGVLLVAIGKATRLLEYMVDRDKMYCGDIVFGASTATDDAAGAVIAAADPSPIDVPALARVMGQFLGEISQVPPQFSAVKLRGQKAYEVARRGGTSELVSRKVKISGLALLEWKPPVASVLVRCSKGTYIRSIARDAGNQLGVGAHLGALVRVRSGDFSLFGSISVEDLRLAAEFGYMERLVWPPDAAVYGLPALLITDDRTAMMKSGRRWEASSGPDGERVRVYSASGAFLGLVEREDGHWQPRIVMSEVD